MGSSILQSDEEIRKAWRKAAAVEGHRLRSERMELSKKIVLAIVDKISGHIIRPGPKPEERECYVMAQELRDFSPELEKLVSEILKIG